MTAIRHHFELAENLSVTKFLKKLGKHLDFEIASQQYSIKTFYDSFDWRLYNADMMCEFRQSKASRELALIDKNTGKQLAVEPLQGDMPRFSGQFPQGLFKQGIASALEMRALLPLSQLPYQHYRINILNKDRKTVLRLQIEEHKLLTTHISLHELKGYAKAAEKVSTLLQNKLNIKATKPSRILHKSLKRQGRKTQDYSSKLAIQLSPDMPADQACKLIYCQLLTAIQVNEASTIADIDSEFLHDFRVAIRRTRAGLSQIKNTLPARDLAKHTRFFAWLGQITGTTRDLDVYLLSYQDYQAALPKSLQADLAPLYAFLKQKQVLAQQALVAKLEQPEYRKQLKAWEHFLQQDCPKKATASHAKLSIKTLADQRIWKVYTRLLHEANAIQASSPAEALHDLRKTCKKLRYLMEFFQSLYPAQEFKAGLKALKGFQAVLGDFQDYEIQEISLKQFSEEMRASDTHTNTFLAMGVLVQHLDALRCAARNDFAAQFKNFKEPHKRKIFQHLFAPKAVEKNA
ncbi:MAG: CHAD domain-containing protein [Methyloprofundus sp.]|nr:CHAD domain-containing protein [Methyloprofundus sp.]